MKYLSTIENKLAVLTLSLLPIILSVYFLYAQQGDVNDYLASYVYYMAFLPGALLAFYVAKKQGFFSRLGKAFAFIGFGMIFMVIGGIVWDYYGYFTDLEPYPSIAEFAYLLVMPCITIGILYIIAIYKLSVKKWSILLAVLASIGWYFYALRLAEFNVAERFSEGIDLVTITDYTYFISDSITAGLAVFLLTLIGGRLSGMLRTLTIGFILFGTANSIFFYRIWNDIYYDGDISDTLFVFSGLCLTLAIVRFYHNLKNKSDISIS